MSNYSIGSALKHAFSVFSDKNAELTSPFQNSNWTGYHSYDVSYGSSSRSDRKRLSPTKEKSLVASMYNKIAIDVAAVPIKHIKTDKNGRYVTEVKSGLNNCLNVEANIDQTGRELIVDIVLSMFDEGVVAVVPVDTKDNFLKGSDSFDILSLRTGKVVGWYPQKVKVKVYDERDGLYKELVLPKSKVALIENPFYSVMNEKNSTLSRLIRKMNLLDLLDDKNGTNKLNMILQLPYTTRSETQKRRASKRLEELEAQLNNSPYGIAYVDGTEKIVQLNRAIESNLVEQVDKLSNDLYSQIGITKSVFDGTADEQTHLNYQNSTIEPILSAITNEMIRKFLTKTARTQGQTLRFIQDPFRLIPINNIADIADKFTRNEILASNEVREIIGRTPVDDPRADELRNKNLNQSNEEITPVSVSDTVESK